MRYVAFSQKNTPHLGAVVEGAVFDVGRACRGYWRQSARRLNGIAIPTTLDALLQGGEKTWTQAARAVAWATKRHAPVGRLDRLQLLAPLPHPGKILCVGLNYRRHAAESGMAAPLTPVLFSKFNNSIAAPDERVPLPANAEQYDYEAELAVVIGKRARNVSKRDALSYVFGYCNSNDLSARDLQMRTSQWLLGKTPDKFLPLGPCIVSADEVPNPQKLRIRCWVNGQQRQDSNTADMIFSIAHVISYASQYFTLEPGDVISTGTPEGVIFGMEQKQWLRPGDSVAVEVGDFGRLTNLMVNVPRAAGAKLR
ncbi:2-hydroxyhepta-2,4-diene-1,7-dioate isomerase [Anaerolineae bacterium]|nr:fumarylacetoacetate hydrolase domain-containing protein 2 homolog [Anaerolineaceae bacterium]GBL37073.1 fumarylacetoacetate hydrolase domain-containing protein 2 homolog [Anaerolineaceae bacterium]GDX67128.1 2-hydroxyhepta-2,4-diene-1,7-dioate isomerase [Anaerolineae bacterium]